MHDWARGPGPSRGGGSAGWQRAFSAQSGKLRRSRHGRYYSDTVEPCPSGALQHSGHADFLLRHRPHVSLQQVPVQDPPLGGRARRENPARAGRPAFGSWRGGAVSFSGRSGGDLRAVGGSPHHRHHRISRLDHCRRLYRHPGQFHRGAVRGGHHDARCHPSCIRRYPNWPCRKLPICWAAA